MDEGIGRVLSRGLRFQRGVLARALPFILFMLGTDAVVLAISVIWYENYDYITIFMLMGYLFATSKFKLGLVIGIWKYTRDEVALYLDGGGNLVFLSPLCISISLADVTRIEIMDDPKMQSARLHMLDGSNRLLISGAFEGGAEAISRLTGKPLSPPL